MLRAENDALQEQVHELRRQLELTSRQLRDTQLELSSMKQQRQQIPGRTASPTSLPQLKRPRAVVDHSATDDAFEVGHPVSDDLDIRQSGRTWVIVAYKAVWNRPLGCVTDVPEHTLGLNGVPPH